MMLYAWDKSAAKNDRWRTKESTLHLYAVLGGWPGAVLGQRFWRHKTQKVSFRRVFWLTVLANLAVFISALTSHGQALIADGIDMFTQLTQSYTSFNFPN